MGQKLSPVWNGGNSKELDSYGLMTSPAVWITGIELAVPMERVAFLHKTQEAKHSLGLEVFVVARDNTHIEREKRVNQRI